MTKEEILDTVVRDWATPPTRQDCYEAMDSYSRQMAIAFKKWCDGNEAEIGYGLGRNASEEELFDLFNNNNPIK